MRRLLHLSLQLFMLVVQVQDAVLTPSPDFGKHVARASQFTDQNSRRKVRTYQLYSRTSGKHVQVLGRRVVAQGEDGDPYAQLVAETDTFGGNIRLRGAQTGYYICMNKRGKLVGKKNGRGRYCVFKEVYLENNYTALVNSRHPNWYMAFNRQGRAKNGARTRPRQRDVHLIKRPIQGRDADYNFPPFCIVRSRRRTRRMRMLKRCTNRRSA
uniref:Fibroblast growth factor 8 n=1 Tax=Eptatretus burgeri TaxID=7764 RepID=A0A8C4R4B2_EPTBU